MPRVSHYSLGKDQLAEISSYFTYLLSSLRNSSDIDLFLNEFLTEEEKIMLSKRLVLYMMLQKKYPDLFIQHTLHVSYETIRIYKNHGLYSSIQFQKIIAKLLTRQQTKDFLQKIEGLLKVFHTIATAKTNMRSRTKIASGQWK